MAAALALSFAGPAAAQITLTAGETVPYRLGENVVTQFDTENETGGETAAIEALIARSGPNQTWDFTGLASVEVTATAVVTAGATGPAEAATEPFVQATSTYQLLLPPVVEDGETIEGTVYGYYRLDGDGLHNLGLLVYSTAGGETVGLGFAYTPSGLLTAPPSYTFGSTWESDYVEEFFGAVNKRSTFEVDGWGVVVAPGLAAPVPALRVKQTEVGLDAGGERVTYEFRTAGAVAAAVQPAQGSDPTPLASLSVVRPGQSTASATGPDAGGVGAPWPNPAATSATLALDLSADAATVTLLDVLGRRATAPVEVAPDGRVRLDVSALPPGLYVARVQTGGQTWARPLTVVR